MPVGHELLERLPADAPRGAVRQAEAGLLLQAQQLVKEQVVFAVRNGGVVQHVVAVGVPVELVHQVPHSLFHRFLSLSHELVASTLDLFHRRELDVQLLDALAGEGDLRDGPLDGDDRAAAELAVLDRVARLQRSGRGLRGGSCAWETVGAAPAATNETAARSRGLVSRRRSTVWSIVCTSSWGSSLRKREGRLYCGVP